MLTSAQVRAGRSLLNWSQAQLAEESGVDKGTVFKLEKGTIQPRQETSHAIIRTFLANGVTTTKNGGVEFQAVDVQIYEGVAAFKQWYENVYHTIENGGDIAVSGCREADFGRWFTPEEDELHADRMSALRELVACRVILQEGDHDFAYASYITYRWIDKAHWNPNPLYVYGSKLAFIEFKEEGPTVTVINSVHTANAFRTFFMAVWDGVCSDIPQVRPALS